MMKLSLLSRFALIPLVGLALTACSDPGGEVVPAGDTVVPGQDAVGTPDSKGGTDTVANADLGGGGNDQGTTDPGPAADPGTSTDPGTATDTGKPPVTQICTDAENSTLNTCIGACADGNTTCQQACFGGLSAACSSAYAALAQCAQAASCAQNDAQCALTNCPDEATAVFGSGPEPSDCDPVAGTGCQAGQVCTYVAQGQLGCAAPGTAGIDEACQSAGCASGACLSLDGTNYTCFQFCSATNNQCPDGRPCNIALQGTTDTFCGDLPESCDIYAQDCTAPQGCYVIDAQGNTDCSPNNGKALGASCAYANDCAPGLLCAGSAGAGICATICDTTGSVPCTTGTCASIGAGTIGACQGG